MDSLLVSGLLLTHYCHVHAHGWAIMLCVKSVLGLWLKLNNVTLDLLSLILAYGF